MSCGLDTILPRGAFDLFVPFCELAHENAREAGVVSLIVPNKILSAEYAAALRQFLSEKTTLVHFLDASKCRPFEAAVYPVAILFCAGRRHGPP